MDEKDLKGTNWKPGWYKGEIQQVDKENYVTYIFYFKDREVYTLGLLWMRSFVQFNQ